MPTALSNPVKPMTAVRSTTARMAIASNDSDCRALTRLSSRLSADGGAQRRVCRSLPMEAAQDGQRGFSVLSRARRFPTTSGLSGTRSAGRMRKRAPRSAQYASSNHSPRLRPSWIRLKVGLQAMLTAASVCYERCRRRPGLRRRSTVPRTSNLPEASI